MRVNSSKIQIRRQARQARIVRARREGVILLVVLGLLALFALVGVTFVITASQHKKGATAAAREEQHRDPYDAELNIAMEQVLYGTLNKYSVIGPHSLLEDMYGVGGAQPGVIPVTGFQANDPTFVVGQSDPMATDPLVNVRGTMMYITNLPAAAPVMSTNLPVAPVQPVIGGVVRLRNEPGYYVGRVITMLSGPCAGQSARITGYSVTGTAPNELGTLRLFPFPGMQYSTTSQGWANTPLAAGQPTPLCPAGGDQFVINGREFAGTGFGYDPSSTTGLLDYGGAGNEIALRPNPRSLAYLQYMYGADMRPFTSDDPPASIFLPNEAWDAPDYQNMALAWKEGNVMRIPSFHRPALINYWINHGGLTEAREAEIVLRPTITAHPEFNRSINPALAGQDVSSSVYQNFLRTGPWDVDTDGDGVNDSIWIDPGLPVQVDSLGRKFKRLVAVQVIDLDGRLNLNANGTLAPGATPGPHPYRTTMNTGATTPTGGVLAVDFANPLQAQLSLGMGTDTSNISLTADDGNPQSYALMTNDEFLQLCLGRIVGGRAIEGRNGEGRLLINGQYPRPGITGFDSNYPPAPTVQAAGPSKYEFRGNQNEVYAYFSPFDWQGVGALGLDARGNPISSLLFPGPLNGFLDFNADGNVDVTEYARLLINEQAEMDLSLSGSRRRYSPSAGSTAYSVDNPFGLDELELLLRRFDIDTSARSGRLQSLCPNFYNDFTRTALATTESWHTPVAYFAATPEILGGTIAGQGGLLSANNPRRLPVNLTIMDLVWGKMKAAEPGANDDVITDRMHALFDPTSQPDRVEAFAPELQAGRPMNINRLFGNQSEEAGGDGAVDGPDSVERLWDGSIVADPPGDPMGIGIPFWNGGVASNNPRQNNVGAPTARYRLAKHLYMLMMLVKPKDYHDAQGLEVLDPAQLKELTARRIAQWAINVVDFRDADAIMTPFEYDVDPFNANGWGVDGNPNTVPINDSGDEKLSDRRLVWGCESPDLLLTESKAYHNRHTADMMTEMANMGQTPARTDHANPAMQDDTFDQVRLPAGGAFIELYCTRNPHNPFFSGDLYTGGKLDLGKMSVGGTGVNPVWRIVVTQSSRVSADNDVRARANTLADSASMEPVQVQRDPLVPANQSFCMLPTGMQTNAMTQGPPVQIDRIVWMARRNALPTGNMVANPELVYYNRGLSGMDPQLSPGQYAVIGGRATSAIGPAPNPVRVDLADFTQMFDSGGAPRAPYNTLGMGGAEIKPPLGIVVSGGDSASHQVVGAMPQPFQNGVPFSISEPLFNFTSAALPARATSYYPLAGIGTTAGSGTTIPYTPGEYFDRFTTPLDDPLDKGGRMGWDEAPLGAENLYKTGTTQNYKTLFLQRLANPLLEWNPVDLNDPQHRTGEPVNPYISVDWLPIDLTVFNTEEQMPQTEDPDDMPPFTVGFQARERGENPLPMPPVEERFNIWQPISVNPATGAAPAGIFNMNLVHTLGYLNSSFGAGWKPGDANYPGNHYRGDAKEPFHWLTWLDRPFASQMELLSVPATSAARLGKDFSARRAGQDLHYAPRPSPYDKPSMPYGHLLNFFHTANPTAMNYPNDAPDFHRALAMMDVAPRFSGTQNILDPRKYQFASPHEKTPGEFYPFYAPDNYFSAYREPGRVNLNTVSSSYVWLGITNRYSPADIGSMSYWDNIMKVSRQGYSGGGFNPDMPTEFAHPYLANGDTYHVPIAALKENSPMVPRSPIEFGLMRPNPLPGFTDIPMLTLESSLMFHNPGIGKGPFNDSDRNAYFRFQPLQRLTNLVTGRSNVYAVWITIGYFEVKERNSTDGLTPAYSVDNYPDGYEILGELNSDTGDIERHRAFYIIDRSIPVAFQRGVRHNAMDAVRLQRIIE